MATLIVILLAVSQGVNAPLASFGVYLEASAKTPIKGSRVDSLVYLQGTMPPRLAGYVPIFELLTSKGVIANSGSLVSDPTTPSLVKRALRLPKKAGTYTIRVRVREKGGKLTELLKQEGFIVR